MKKLNEIIEQAQQSALNELNSVDTLLFGTHEALQNNICKIIKQTALQSANCCMDFDLVCAFVKSRLRQEFDEERDDSKAFLIAKEAEKMGFTELSKKMIQELT